jgi:hypothetical protein
MTKHFNDIKVKFMEMRNPGGEPIQRNFTFLVTLQLKGTQYEFVGVFDLNVLFESENMIYFIRKTPTNQNGQLIHLSNARLDEILAHPAFEKARKDAFEEAENDKEVRLYLVTGGIQNG